ncbi:MAG TPA: hypothetical protein VM328_07215 [Fimbriimonadaceae bacterium]|nr:hypothetical protein [Fimbriimonadaceae bacterium]
MKHVVSISLGSCKDDKTFETTILDVPFRIERLGVDGDLQRFARMFSDLDGKVDALGVGGADLFVVIGKHRYTFRQIARLVGGARHTPVVDGSGLKHTLEREAVYALARAGVVDWSQENVLLVSAVDRYGMAQALADQCPNVIYGDLLFGLGLPIPLRSYRAVSMIGTVALPIITRLPFKWFYPTGKQQERRRPRFPKHFDWATLIAGDKHYIRRYAPEKLSDKTILTQSVRKADLEWLREAGARRIITTTPVMGGETFATNVMEAVLVTLAGKRPELMQPEDYLDLLARLAWKPTVIDLRAPAEGAGSRTLEGTLQRNRSNL